MFFIADNSEFSSPNVNKNDVFCMGGFFANINTLKEIEIILSNVKENYNIHKELPLKWNMKDQTVTKIYDSYNAVDKLELLISKSEDWREDLFQGISILSLRLMVSGMRILGATTTKEDVCEMLFINLMERLQKEWEKNIDNSINFIVLDWEDKMRNVYSNTYCKFYYKGEPKWSITPLVKLKNTFPALGFSVCLYNPLVQLADLIVGCYRMFFEFCFKDKNRKVVERLFPYIMKRTILDESGDPFGRGIIFRPKDDQEKIRAKLLELKIL